MQIIDGIIWYTKEEMFAEVRQRGLIVKECQFEEWQRYGIMPLSRRQGQGKGGVMGLWSHQQLEMLCSLCQIHQKQNIRSWVTQCNLPVWLWMYWGEDYGIGLDQVKRAMQTWIQRRYPARIKELKQGARHLVEIVANGTKGGKRLASHDVEAWLVSANGNEQDLSDCLWQVYHPERAAGPQAIRLTPDLVASYMKGRLLGLNALSMGQVFSDQRWWWARHLHLSSLSDYLHSQSTYARETAGTPAATLFGKEKVDQLCSSACLDLATVIGMGLLMEQEKRGLPVPLDLMWWEEQVMEAHVHGQVEPSLLILPNGLRPARLAIISTIKLIDYPLN